MGVCQVRSLADRCLQFLKALFRMTFLRKQLAQGGWKAIESSNDPMIVLARTVDQKAREVRKRYESEVTGVERANYAKIARAPPH